MPLPQAAYSRAIGYVDRMWQKQVWSNLRLYLDISLEVLRTRAIDINQDNQDSSRSFFEYKSEVLQLPPICWPLSGLDVHMVDTHTYIYIYILHKI
jgi:hypothetical protein